MREYLFIVPCLCLSLRNIFYSLFYLGCQVTNELCLCRRRSLYTVVRCPVFVTDSPLPTPVTSSFLHDLPLSPSIARSHFAPGFKPTFSQILPTTGYIVAEECFC